MHDMTGFIMYGGKGCGGVYKKVKIVDESFVFWKYILLYSMYQVPKSITNLFFSLLLSRVSLSFCYELLSF